MLCLDALRSHPNQQYKEKKWASGKKSFYHSVSGVYYVHLAKRRVTLSSADTFAYSLYPDQAWSGSKLFDILMVFLK